MQNVPSSSSSSKSKKKQQHVVSTKEEKKKGEEQKKEQEEASPVAAEPEQPKGIDDLSLDDIEVKEMGVIGDGKKISPAYKKKLQSIGISDPMTLAVANPEDLINYMGLARDVATNMIEAAQKLLAQNKIIDKGVVSAREELERRKSVRFLTTGAKALDEILKGGIETRAVTELYAEFGSGKTQMAFTLAVNAQLPTDKGGLGGKVIWLDTERTFRPERIEQIAISRDLDAGAVIDGIAVAKIKNAAHLEMFIKELARLIRQHNAKLVVVDSIIALHRAEFAGRGTLYDRQHRINIIMNQLVKLADFFNVAIVITNQVSASPDTYFGDPVKPTGGNVISHFSTYRLSLRKGGGNTRIVRIVDSPYHPYVDCKVQIDVEGVTDVKEEKK